MIDLGDRKPASRMWGPGSFSPLQDENGLGGGVKMQSQYMKPIEYCAFLMTYSECYLFPFTFFLKKINPIILLSVPSHWQLTSKLIHIAYKVKHHSAQFNY